MLYVAALNVDALITLFVRCCRVVLLIPLLLMLIYVVVVFGVCYVRVTLLLFVLVTCYVVDATSHCCSC